MNERIAKALVENIVRGNSRPGAIQFHDEQYIYTVTVTREVVLLKSTRDTKGQMVSQGGSGSPCT